MKNIIISLMSILSYCSVEAAFSYGFYAYMDRADQVQEQERDLVTCSYCNLQIAREDKYLVKYKVDLFTSYTTYTCNRHRVVAYMDLKEVNNVE